MSMDHILSPALAAPDSPFIPGTNIQFAWDSVSLTSILSCPRRYQYQIIEGQTPRSPNYAIALVFGILFHEGLQYYHMAKAAGEEHDDAVFTTVKRLLQQPATATLPTDTEIDAMAESHDPDEDDGITLRNSKIRTRYYLIRSVVWYLEHYKKDPVTTIILPTGQPAVELSFRLPLPIDVQDHQLMLCGHIDRGVEFNGFLYASDYKTTKSLTSQFFEMFDLSHQMTGYTTAGQVIFDQPVKGALIDGVALQVGAVKFARSFSSRTPGQIGEYFDLLKYAGAQAVQFATTEVYPMNTASCYFCEYKAVCRQPPEYRATYLKQFFERRPGWNPLENR